MYFTSPRISTRILPLFTTKCKEYILLSKLQSTSVGEADETDVMTRLFGIAAVGIKKILL
jgi:hypothetical protein